MLPIAFSIHAATTVEDLDRERLRNLIAYVARPAVALNRLSWTESGDIKIALKTPYRSGSSNPNSREAFRFLLPSSCLVAEVSKSPRDVPPGPFPNAGPPRRMPTRSFRRFPGTE